jgi:glutathione S-transferase
VSDQVQIVHTINAPREEVFRAWTDPDELRRWWGPGEFTCPEATVDLRPGGKYRLVMQPPGGEAFVVAGTYREVEPPSRLVYTWRWETGPAADGSESLVSVEFRESATHPPRTELVLTHSDFPPSHGPAPYQMGWEGGLEKFERLFSRSAVDA